MNSERREHGTHDSTPGEVRDVEFPTYATLTEEERRAVDGGAEWPVIIRANGPRDAARLLAGTTSVDQARYQLREVTPESTAKRRMPDADEILTPEDVARHLAIPKKTVIALCADGRLVGAFKAGRRWRIPGRAVRRMANGDR